jgi:hypothetical protein
MKTSSSSHDRNDDKFCGDRALTELIAHVIKLEDGCRSHLLSPGIYSVLSLYLYAADDGQVKNLR